MNILIINHYAGSPNMGMEFRPYFMSREWKAMGHNVLIVCASNAHVRNVQFDIKESLVEKNIENQDYLILKTPEYSRNSFKRVLNMYAFVKGLKKNARYIAENYKPDIVIASSTYPLDIFPARKIAKLSEAKLFFEVHDLWPLSPMELGGYSRWHPFILIMQYAENYAYKHSDKVVSMLPNALEHMKNHGLKEEKFFYVPNGIVADEWNINESIPENIKKLIEQERKKGHKIIAYAGSHGVANALDSLIDAMILIKEQAISLFLIGDGPLKSELINRVKSENLNNVFFIDSIKKTLIPAVLDKFDFLYLGLQNQSLFRFGISPNKLIDYLMAGKPIIQAINAGNDIVKDANCGISIEPENPEKIADAVMSLSKLNDSEIKELGDNGKKYCLKNHDYKVLAQKFINIMED